MTNKEIIDTYIICGKLYRDLLDDKFETKTVLNSSISIKGLIEVYLMYGEHSRNIFMYLFRIGDIIIDSFGDDRRFCKECIEDISKTYKFCIKHIGKFGLLSSLANLYNNLWAESVGNRKLKEFKSRLRLMIACLSKFQGIDLNNGIIIDNKKYKIIEYKADHAYQRVFKIKDYKNRVLSYIKVCDDSSLEFIGERNNQIRSDEIKSMLKDSNIRLIITLDSVYDRWVENYYEEGSQ